MQNRIYNSMKQSKNIDTLETYHGARTDVSADIVSAFGAPNSRLPLASWILFCLCCGISILQGWTTSRFPFMLSLWCSLWRSFTHCSSLPSHDPCSDQLGICASSVTRQTSHGRLWFLTASTPTFGPPWSSTSCGNLGIPQCSSIPQQKSQHKGDT